jgi:uncharacterized OB-fold protein
MTEQVPVSAGLFALTPGVADAGHLLGGICGACKRVHFPASRDCPYCGAEDCRAEALSRRGALWLFTTVTNRPPGYAGEMPFGFGVVELPEGVRLITRITEIDPARLAFGMAMRLCFVPLHLDADGREVITYAFAPEP